MNLIVINTAPVSLDENNSHPKNDDGVVNGQVTRIARRIFPYLPNGHLTRYKNMTAYRLIYSQRQ